MANDDSEAGMRALVTTRMYSEHAGLGTQSNAGIVDIPVGCGIFPREIFPAPAIGPRWSTPS